MKKIIITALIVLGIFGMSKVYATVTGDTLKHVYVMDETTTVFPYTFTILAESDIKVIRYDTDAKTSTTLTLTTDYTVVGEGNDSGTRTVTYAGATAYDSDYYLILQSNVAYTQPTDYVVGGSFQQETHEAALDRLAIQIKQLKEVQNRTFKADASQEDEIVFPAAEEGYLYSDGTDFSFAVPTTTSLDYDGTIDFGADASKDSTPAIGDLYFSTDIDVFYRCFSSNTWTPDSTFVLPASGTFTVKDSSSVVKATIDSDGDIYTVSDAAIHHDLSVGRDLTVDAGTLYVDSSQNKVRVGASTRIPTGTLSVYAVTDPRIVFGDATTDNWHVGYDTSTKQLDFGTGGSLGAGTVFAITATGDLTISGNVSHAGIVQGWCNLSGSGTISINDSYNVSGIVDNGTGDYTITWDRSFKTPDYSCVGSCNGGAGIINITTLSPGSARILSSNDEGTPVDRERVCVMAAGRQ